RLFLTTWYSTPLGRSLRRRSWSSATVRPRYSVTMIAVDFSSWLCSPSTAFAFAGMPPPLRFVFGPVLTFAMCPPFLIDAGAPPLPPTPAQRKGLRPGGRRPRAKLGFALVLASAGSASRRIQALSGTGFSGYE